MARILVVEDHEDAARLLAMLLELEGHEVVVAHTVAEALGQTDVQVALVDLTLPDGSGLDVARALPGVLRIAMTGHDRDRVWEACKEAGFSNHLTKPIDHGDLLELLPTR